MVRISRTPDPDQVARQGDDERRHPGLGDDDRVHQPDHRGEGDRRPRSRPTPGHPGSPGRSRRRHHDATDRADEGDRQVDLADQQHEHDADRDRRDRRHLQQQVREVALGVEGVVERARTRRRSRSGPTTIGSEPSSPARTSATQRRRMYSETDSVRGVDGLPGAGRRTPSGGSAGALAGRSWLDRPSVGHARHVRQRHRP